METRQRNIVAKFEKRRAFIDSVRTKRTNLKAKFLSVLRLVSLETPTHS